MVAVTAVEPLADYTLRLTFDDGSERVVDLADELWGSMGEPLRDPAYFQQVRIDPELRTVVWPNGFDLDPDVLHGRRSQDGPPAATRQSAAQPTSATQLLLGRVADPVDGRDGRDA